MKHQIKLIALALCALGSTGAQAVSFTQNDMTLDINGTVNGYYVNRQVDVKTIATGKTTSSTNSELTNGLLPGWINFVATTKVDGLDIKAHVSFAPGINNNSKVVGLPIGNQAGAGTVNPYSQIDTRNLYFQFGNASMGTVKFGRDIGLFGQNIILSDMTLIGVGGASHAGIPYNTTFGMIGHGYFYTGFQPQITYTTPAANGLQAAVGIFQPSKFASADAGGLSTGGANETKTPGFQGKVDYDWKGATPGKLWVGMVQQDTSCADTQTVSCAAVKTFSASGQEVGVKIGVGNFEGVAYGFSGKGLGLSTTGAMFFAGGNTVTGERTESKGYMLQGTYKLTEKTKVGLNYGENKDKNGAVSADLGGLKETKNKAFTFGVYHSLNKYVTLVAEVNQETMTNAQGFTDLATPANVIVTDVKTKSISLGGIIFF